MMATIKEDYINTIREIKKKVYQMDYNEVEERIADMILYRGQLQSIERVEFHLLMIRYSKM